MLGILDKATITLGNNTKVDFSHSLIFMTSNLGASEMSALVSPKLGLSRAHSTDNPPGGNKEMARKISQTGLEAARRKFDPEFMNRIDKTVVFKSLGENDLRRILEVEIEKVQRRIFDSPSAKPFVLSASESAKSFLLSEGIDVRYGAPAI